MGAGYVHCGLWGQEGGVGLHEERSTLLWRSAGALVVAMEVTHGTPARPVSLLMSTCIYIRH